MALVRRKMLLLSNLCILLTIPASYRQTDTISFTGRYVVSISNVHDACWSVNVCEVNEVVNSLSTLFEYLNLDPPIKNVLWRGGGR